jgi:glucose-1-phosphate thymidylyltransferase
MKGIILAGGRATRLYPVTKVITKQLLPVYDKPLIYYPLSVQLLAGIREIMIIGAPESVPLYKQLFGDGSQLGIRLSYAVQDAPRGIAESFLIAKDFIRQDTVSLVLGDNIFFGEGLSERLQNAAALKKGALVFGYYVKDPERYGVIEFDKNKKIVAIREKPAQLVSRWAVTGLYFYDNEVVNIAGSIKPSARGELEITDVNNVYLGRGELSVDLLGRGFAWLDTGTYDSLMDASSFIRTFEERQSLHIGCIEEVVYRLGYISREQLLVLAAEIRTSYGDYLRRIAQED